MARRKVKEPLPREWFTERIGKRVYRNDNQCSCEICKDIKDNGIVIKDETHAIYLWEIQYEYLNDKINLNYRDEK